MSLPSQEMIDAARFFSQRGWLLGTCGNLSVRTQEEPLEVLATPSGRDKSQLRPEDFVRVDAQGNSLVEGRKASAELGVHLAVYRRKAAGAVYHVHSIWNNLAGHLWGGQGYVEFAGVEMIKGLAGKTLHSVVRLPIVANSDDMAELAAHVDAGFSPDCPAVLVHQHGLYAWGDSAGDARRHVEILEFLLEFHVRRHSL